MSRHYYALYAPYGIRVAYGDCHWPVVHVFASRAERNDWVAADPLKREPCTAKDAKRYDDPWRW